MQMLSQTDPFLQKQQINEGLDKSDWAKTTQTS